MPWTIDEVRKAFSGRLIGKLLMRMSVCETVLKLPDNLIEFVTQNIWFISSPEDAWAFTFRGSDLRDQHLIIISDDLLNEDQSQIQSTILHEIGHVILGHKNSIGYQQTQSEIKQQELEADQFADQFI